MIAYAIWALSLVVAWALGHMRHDQRVYSRGYGDGVEWALWMRARVAADVTTPADADVRYCEHLSDTAHPC